MTAKQSNLFQRFILPGFAFKAVVIGGGYATGRELAEFFLPSGPWGGLLAIGLATLIWSFVCAVTFVFAMTMGSMNYRSFFKALLGRFWVVFEISYILLLILILAVFGAAAGAIGSVVFGWPVLIGTLLLASLIIGFTAFGNESVEGLFKYVSFLLYGVYALFIVLALTKFGDRIVLAFSRPDIGAHWIEGGLVYSGYNVVGAVAILPVLRHMQSRRDAVWAGVLAGPLAMTPALLFFICMAAWPQVKAVELPSDFLLGKLNLPFVRLAFQAMIFAALLESGSGMVHAVNQRIAGAFGVAGRALHWRVRLFASAVLVIGSVFLADRFGLVQLIANGYRYLSYVFLAIYVLPILLVGLPKVLRAAVIPTAANYLYIAKENNQ